MPQCLFLDFAPEGKICSAKNPKVGGQSNYWKCLSLVYCVTVLIILYIHTHSGDSVRDITSYKFVDLNSRHCLGGLYVI